MPRLYTKKGGGEGESVIDKTSDFLKRLGGKLKIRIPKRNTLSNRIIEEKEIENRGKYSKKYYEKRNADDIANGIRNSNSNNYASDMCIHCNSSSDVSFVRTKEYDVVCTKCGVVQPNETFYYGQTQTLLELSPAYQEKTYISERLRQFANLEPRIPRKDLFLIGLVYCEFDKINCEIIDSKKTNTEKDDELRDKGLFGWFKANPGDITKETIKKLLQIIDKKIQFTEEIKKGIKTKSFTNKYSERWLQIKIFICGEDYYTNHICDIPDKELLNELLTEAALVSYVYKHKRVECGISNIKKKNMIKIDLLFLLLLYSISEETLKQFGWYFTSKKLHSIYIDKMVFDKSKQLKKSKKTIEEDLSTLSLVFNYLNSITDKKRQFTFEIATLDEIIQIASTNNTAYNYF